MTPSCSSVSTDPLGPHPVSVMPEQEDLLQSQTSWHILAGGCTWVFLLFRLNMSYIIWVSDPRSFSKVAVDTGEEIKDNI